MKTIIIITPSGKMYRVKECDITTVTDSSGRFVIVHKSGKETRLPIYQIEPDKIEHPFGEDDEYYYSIIRELTPEEIAILGAIQIAYPSGGLSNNLKKRSAPSKIETTTGAARLTLSMKFDTSLRTTWICGGFSLGIAA